MARKNQNKQSNVSQPMFELLENRTMMSVAPLPHVAAVPTVHAAALIAKKTPAKPALPAISAEPAVTDSSISYTNFAVDPLFSTAGPKPTDIQQGDIGDCYFLSTLASIAKLNPTLIRNDIINNNDGTYTVKLFAGTKQIRVDAELPTWSDGQLAYANLGAQNCTWVAIVEKAYATAKTKVDSYSSIDGGWMTDAFTAMGVRSVSVYAVATATTLFNLLRVEILHHEYLTYATGVTIKGGAPLIADHAYMIDSVAVNAKNQPVSVTLRNPWGNAGPAVDGSNDNGYVTITAAQALANFSGIVIGLA